MYGKSWGPEIAEVDEDRVWAGEKNKELRRSGRSRRWVAGGGTSRKRDLDGKGRRAGLGRRFGVKEWEIRPRASEPKIASLREGGKSRKF